MSPKPKLNEGLPLKSNVRLACSDFIVSQKVCIVFLPEDFNDSIISLLRANTNYAEDNVEAILRTYVQHCNNAHFIFAGSQRHIMGNIFLTASRPFYQSVSMMHLESIPLEEYIKFAQKHFKEAEKNISKEAIEQIYQYFEGITWYMQKVLHTLYDMTPVHEIADVSMVEEAICQIIGSFQYTYSETIETSAIS